MFGFGKREAGLGIAAAAALAACSPEIQTKTGADMPGASSVMQEGANGTLEITIPEEGLTESPEHSSFDPATDLPPQYTPAEEAQILSGTTQERDMMNTQELENLRYEE
jgi:hypothetical protein